MSIKSKKSVDDVGAKSHVLNAKSAECAELKSTNDEKVHSAHSAQIHSDSAHSTLSAHSALSAHSTEHLDSKDYILLYSTTPISISQLAKKTGLNPSNISMHIQNSRRSNGLVDIGYIEAVEKQGNVPLYKITEKGLNHLKSISETYKQQEQCKLQEIKNKEDLNNRITFFEEFLKDGINSLQPGKPCLTVDFLDLAKKNPLIADYVLDEPEESLKEMKIAVETLGRSDVNVRFVKLSSDCIKVVGALRTRDLGKFVSLRGSIVACGDVRPQVTSAQFECPGCGNVLNVLQMQKQFLEPLRCGCGRKGKFSLINKELIDAQTIFLEELIEVIGARTEQKRLSVLLKNDLTRVDIQPALESSEPIKINGWLKEIPVDLRSGAKSTTFDFVFEANSIELDADLKQLDVTPAEIKEFRTFAKKNPVGDLVKSFAPLIKKRDKEKERLLECFVSGGCKFNSKFRDDSHVLLIGDPGTGKSSLMLESHNLMRSRWVSGKNVTAAGLIGTTVRDDLTGKGVMLSKGSLPMAHNSICFVDELDKMNPDHADALNEPLENQSCSIDKWDKHQTFRCDSTLVAAANPSGGGRLDRNDRVLPQINFSGALIDRFDTIMVFYDSIDDQTKSLALQILSESESKDATALKPPEFLRKYLYYARHNFDPKLPKTCQSLLASYFIKLQTMGRERNISVTFRQLKGLHRLARARAKLRLSNVVSQDDCNAVIQLSQYFHKQIGLDVGNVIEEEVVL